jgi:hypothetical protein
MTSPFCHIYDDCDRAAIWRDVYGSSRNIKRGSWMTDDEFRTGVKATDNIRPTHYKQGAIECWDALKAHLSRDEFIGFLRGNIAKYEWRLGHKGNPLEDARKMREYQDKLIEALGESA